MNSAIRFSSDSNFYTSKPTSTPAQPCGIYAGRNSEPPPATAAELNPLQLKRIYEILWVIGFLLKSEKAFDFLAENYQPWPETEFCRVGR